MTIEENHFKQWFEDPIHSLNTQPHAAFAVLMIVFPLAERYFRQKSGCGEGNLTSKFYQEFCTAFPMVAPSQAESFWHAYRNGLLHQATFSLATRRGTVVPKAWITGATSASQDFISYDAAADAFTLIPKKFSERVLEIIKSDFTTFLAGGAPNHPLPTIETRIHAITPGDTIPLFDQTSRSGVL